MTIRFIDTMLAVLLLSVEIGCSSTGRVVEGSGSGGDTGGAASGGSGGVTNAGGTTSSSGSISSGGTLAAGGTTNAGGKLATGGSKTTGDTTSAGGNGGTGGGVATGGSLATGGTTAAGGSPGTGDRSGWGGNAGTGGRSGTGGSPATGGTPGTGGGPATGGSSGIGGKSGTSGGVSTGTPPTGTMRIFYLRPSDVAFDQRYPDGIGKIMIETQTFFQQQLGRTFKLNDPIVEVVVGEHVQSWYENTANGGDKYWWSATNGQQEIARRLGLSIPDRRWMVVSEVSAEGSGAGGGATGGWVLLCGHDADGGASYPAEKARWVGGMVHEVGHAFGLPDSTSTDGTCMSASFYGWPNCTFTQSQKDKMLNGNWGVGKFLF